MSEQINSEAYWSGRFSTDWEKSDGRHQSRFFAELATRLIPRWLSSAIRIDRLTICDWGCALGDGTDMLAAAFDTSVTGIDFSPVAIESAQSTYRNCEFIARNVLTCPIERRWDILFTSNTLEHFAEPWAILRLLSRNIEAGLVLLVPYHEVVRHEEHAYTFTADNIPANIDEFYLIQAAIADARLEENTQWPGRQILLVYVKQDFAHRNRLRLSDISTEAGEHVPEFLRKFAMLQQRVIEVETDRSALQLERETLRRKVLETKANYESLEGECDTLRRTILRTEENCRNIEAESVALQRSLAEAHARNTEIETELAARLAFEEVQHKRIVELNEELERERAYGAGLDMLRNDWQYRATALERSTSWKIMAPFRHAKTAVGLILNLSRHRARIKHLAYLSREIGVSGAARWAYMRVTRRMPYISLPKYHSDSISIGSPSPAFREMFLSVLRTAQESGRPIYIQLPVIEWNVPLFQRPQQMAMAVGRTGGIAIYFTHNVVDNIDGFREVSENVWLVSDGSFFDELEGAVCTAYSTGTTDLDFLQKIKRKNVLVYEYIDHLDEAISGSATERLKLLRDFCFTAADVIVVSARKLQEEVVAAVGGRRVVVVPNGVDYEHYASALGREEPVPTPIKAFCERYETIVGYFGALAPWIWYEMLNELTGRRGDIGFIFIGPDYYGGMEKVIRRDNVLLTGAVPYQNLPSYAKQFDAAIIPFRHGEIAQTTSPLKLFEYFALEKPVVVTDQMRECTIYPEVFRAADQAAFSRELDRAIAAGNCPEFKSRLRQLALENSWDERARTLLEAGTKSLRARFKNKREISVA
jgi:glycosyltransferase involved in cell wall biosynthesis